jgi:hypothetical protein
MIKVPEDEDRSCSEDDKARMQTAFKWGVRGIRELIADFPGEMEGPEQLGFHRALVTTLVGCLLLTHGRMPADYQERGQEIHDMVDFLALCIYDMAEAEVCRLPEVG